MKIFYRVILSPITLLRFLLVIFVSLFFLITVLVENKMGNSKGTYNFWSSRNWGKSMLLIIGCKVKSNQLPKIDQYLLMPNHRSYIDIFLMAALSPSVFVAKAEIRKWPLLGQSIKATRAILVKREEMKSLLSAMKKIKQSIEQSIPVTIFPEGTTSKGPGLLPFKNGTFKIAAEINVPIIPCAIVYQHKEHAWISKETFVGHFFRELWRPVSWAEVRFGTPLQGADWQPLKEQVNAVIKNMLEEME